MPQRLQFDAQDKAALNQLDQNFELSADGQVATVEGEMTAEIIRSADDRFELTITFPNGRDFLIRLARSQLLQELSVGDDED